MSYSTKKVIEMEDNREFAVATAPILHVSDKATTLIYEPTVSTAQTNVSSTNGRAANAVKFTFPVSQGCVLNPNVNVRFPVKFICEYTARGTTGLPTPNFMGDLKSWCYAQAAPYTIIQSLLVTLGGQLFSHSVQQAIPLFAPLLNPDSRDAPSNSGLFPLGDTADSYETMLGEVDSPFGDINKRFNSGFLPRHTGEAVIETRSSTNALIPNDQPLTVGNTYKTTITDEWVFPIPAEVFKKDDGDSPGIPHAKMVEISMTLTNWHRCIRLNHMESDLMPNNFTVAMPEFSDLPSIVPWTYGLSQNSVEKLNRVPQYFPYADYLVYEDTNKDGGSGSVPVHVTPNSQSLSKVPYKIIIAAVPDRDQLTGSAVSSTPDYYGRISDLSISYLNSGGQLGSLPPHELWRMSRRNGLRMSYQQWKVAGGPVIIDLTKGDLGTNGMFPGATQHANFTLRCQVRCKGRFKLVYGLLNEKSWGISDRTSVVPDSVSFSTDQSTKMFSANADASFEQDSSVSMMGGGFLSKVVDGLSKAASFVGPVISAIRFMKGGSVRYAPNISAGGMPPSPAGTGVDPAVAHPVKNDTISAVLDATPTVKKISVF
jgi:hypothetical protein